MILLTFIFSFLNLWANETVIEKYCFSSSGKMQYMYDKAKILFLPADKIDKDGECFTVQVSESRLELIQKYLKNLDPQMQIAFSSKDVPTEPCRLKIEKIKFPKNNQQNINLSTSSSAESQGLKQISSETFQIQTTKNFELTVNENAIKGACRFIRNDRYDISIEVKKDPRLTQPQVPPGTIITNPNHDPMKIQESSNLSTQIQLTKGNRVELGSIIKNLNGSSQKVDMTTELQVNQSDQNSTEEAYISIE